MGALELFMLGLGWLFWNNNERERRAELQYIQRQLDRAVAALERGEEPILDEFVWDMIEEYNATGQIHRAEWYLRRSRQG